MGVKEIRKRGIPYFSRHEEEGRGDEGLIYEPKSVLIKGGSKGQF